VTDQVPGMDYENPDVSSEENEEGQPQDRTDWKAEAIRAQAQLEMLRNQPAPQPQAPAAPPSEVDVVAREVEELRNSIPPLDANNPNSFWEREKHKERLDAARERLSEARERDRQQQLMRVQYETRSQSVVAQIKAQFAQRPAFAKVEKRFDEMVSRLAPNVRADPNALTVMMKTLLFDAGDSNRPTPPTAPGSGYAPGRQGQPSGKKGAVEFKSQQEAEVAAYYGMTAEEYYSDKYNARGPETEGNGTSIYPFPIRGARR
jgi:hypothetical protein